MWFVILDHTAVRRDADLAIGKGIQGINGLVGRDTRSQMHQNLHLPSGIIIHLLDLDLSLLVGFQDGIDDR